MHWHIITGEYPPQPGGVSDYTRAVALGLSRAGDTVAVWAPEWRGGRDKDEGVVVHRLPAGFGRAARARMGAAFDNSPPPTRVLVQYVPHAFGWKGGNVPFCAWLSRRRSDTIWILFHEVAFPLGRQYTLAQNALGMVNRVMARLVSSAADRVFVSVPSWRHVTAPLVRRGTPIEWLPVPSGIPVVHDPAAVARVRAYYGPAPLVGHFGTYGRLIRPLVEGATRELLRACPSLRVLFIGRGSDDAARVFAASSSDRARVFATGDLAAADVSLAIAACDALMQPYPDGVSTRRTSAMAALAHGVALATSRGVATEPVWNEAAVLSPVDDAPGLARVTAALLADPDRRRQLGAAGRALYASRFAIEHVVERLRS